MFDWHIPLVKQYGSTVQASYRLPYPALSLHVGGLRYYRTAGISLEEPGPFLACLPSDCEVYLLDIPGRLSFSLQFESASFRQQEDRIEFESGGRIFDLPIITPLTEQLARMLQSDFLKLCTWFDSSRPQDQLRLRLGFADIFKWLIEWHYDLSSESPAAELKRRIHEDELVRLSIEEHCRACGFTPNHMRNLFQKKYAMSPLKYRNSWRMQRALSLVKGTRMSIGEIAHATGFEHVSHFSRMFHRSIGQSPREAVQKYRVIV